MHIVSLVDNLGGNDEVLLSLAMSTGAGSEGDKKDEDRRSVYNTPRMLMVPSDIWLVNPSNYHKRRTEWPEGSGVGMRLGAPRDTWKIEEFKLVEVLNSNTSGMPIFLCVIEDLNVQRKRVWLEYTRVGQKRRKLPNRAESIGIFRRISTARTRQ